MPRERKRVKGETEEIVFTHTLSNGDLIEVRKTKTSATLVHTHGTVTTRIPLTRSDAGQFARALESVWLRLREPSNTF